MVIPLNIDFSCGPVRNLNESKYLQVREVVEGDTFVNGELIKGGYATVLTIPPNVKYADTFIKLQRKARRQGRGMWGR
jgi:endonuclease YncB( thermonuclease family)